VRIDAEGDNLVRAVRTPIGVEIPPRKIHVGPPIVEVWAQGLPNLLHEFVHVILSARLDDDHGIDYHAIPYDVSSELGRQVLFEELACCVVSCAYLEIDDGGSTRQRVDAWFVEQVEIQPVFYGMQDEPVRFWTRVEQAVTSHRDAWTSVWRRAYDHAEQTLSWAGAPASVARPRRRLDIFELMQRRDA
jgi:hypothetical protein